jgi:hypothetical protein
MVRFDVDAHLKSSPNANGCGARRLRRFNVTSPQIHRFFSALRTVRRPEGRAPWELVRGALGVAAVMILLPTAGMAD